MQFSKVEFYVIFRCTVPITWIKGATTQLKGSYSPETMRGASLKFLIMDEIETTKTGETMQND